MPISCAQNIKSKQNNNLMKHKIPLLTINNLDDQNGSLKYIKATIHLKDLFFLVDTGATRTCMNETCIKDYLNSREQKLIKEGVEIMGLGTSEHKSRTCVLRKISFNRMGAYDFPVVITNLSDIFAALQMAAGVELHGILGNDFLMKYKAVIDYGNNFMRVDCGTLRTR